MQGVSEASRAPGREFVLCTTSASALDRDKGKVLDPRRMRCILPRIKTDLKSRDIAPD